MPRITIQGGDTLSKLAREHGTSVENLLKLNPQIKDPNLIREGATLSIPDKVSPPSDRDLPSPAIPVPGGGRDLPEKPAGGLSQFASVLDTAVGLARTKRRKFEQEFLGSVTEPGVLPASDFASILGDLDVKSRRFTDPLVKSALDIAGKEDDFLSVFDAKTLGLPFGTTVAEARKLGIVPKATDTEGKKTSKIQEGREFAETFGGSDEELKIELLELGVAAGAAQDIVDERAVKPFLDKDFLLNTFGGESILKAMSNFLTVKFTNIDEAIQKLLESVAADRAEGFTDREILETLREQI